MSLPKITKAAAFFCEFVTKPGAEHHVMNRSLISLSALHPPRTHAAILFGMIVLSALAIVVIVASSLAQMPFANPSLNTVLNLLVVTLIVAGSVACLAVQSEAQARTLEEVVPTDPLTGLISPRHLALAMSRESNAPGGRHPVSSVAVFEIDHLDTIRATYGGAFADDVIRWVADTTYAKLRSPFDRLARIEDGLFIAVLADTTVEQAESICERVLFQLKEAAADIDTNGRRLSLSFGVASFMADTPFEEARDEAVTALYEARRFGRNQVRSRYSGVIFGRS